MSTEDTKQIKIVGFYITVVMVVLLLVGYKTCDKNTNSGCSKAVEECRDEFIPDSSYNSKCSPGAIAEIVTSPRQGIICHCKHFTAPPSSDAGFTLLNK